MANLNPGYLGKTFSRHVVVHNLIDFGGDWPQLGAEGSLFLLLDDNLLVTSQLVRLMTSSNNLARGEQGGTGPGFEKKKNNLDWFLFSSVADLSYFSHFDGSFSRGGDS